MKDGGPAFARPGFAPSDVTCEDCGITDDQTGMSLRDYFAAKAMQGELSSQDKDREWTDTQDGAERLARYSYRVADAMLAAREKGA